MLGAAHGSVPPSSCVVRRNTQLHRGAFPSENAQRIDTAADDRQPGLARMKSVKRDDDRFARVQHFVTGKEFPTLPGLNGAIHLHLTVGDRLFRFAAALGQSAEFQELTQLNGNFANDDRAIAHAT